MVLKPLWPLLCRWACWSQASADTPRRN